MHLRPYRPSDADAVATIYRDAVRGTGATAYDPAQVAVWAAWPDGQDAFQCQLNEGMTLLALEEGRPVAFAQLHPVDHIALLYTATTAGRRGYATALYTALEAQARTQGVTRLHTEASRIARPFFTRQGFQVVAAEIVVRQGLSFERFRMEKVLIPVPLDRVERAG